MIEIKQSASSPKLLFRATNSSGDPMTGLAPTVQLSKDGASFAAAAGAVAEVGGGIYSLTPTSADTATIGSLALVASATDATIQPMLYQVVSHTRAEVIAAIAALTAPDNAGIAAIRAVTDAAGQLVLARPYVPTESPSLVIPAPAGDESLTVVYIHTESITNVKRAGIEITLKLIQTPAKSERVLEIAPKTMTTDADGYAQITVQRGLRYRVTSRELALNLIIQPTIETYNLLLDIP